ncbi:FeoA family protein [Sphingomicrobium astaxanthinifaciens]|uniref:FeoA family protein n=1 Tax=Sphingomicrobium astaxanthinifaciens TaxID=1227949 RepID=UPI001FCC0FAE|nr:FeoA family protein [Sphingomicrobium astaxanthinifaciens]MCJ7421133.1 ferrous iron transport protein A [Sphingomicrobium astaxanthinifaciens]
MTETPAILRTLDQLALGTSGRVAAIDWDALAPRDALRLRHFGFDEGVQVTALHRGPFGADPLAVRVGRMTVAISRAHARAIGLATASPATAAA